MQSVLFHFVSGDALFSGVFLVIAGCLLMPPVSKRWETVVGRAALLVGFLITAAATVPLPWWLYGIWMLSIFVWLLFAQRLLSGSARFVRVISTVVVVSSIVVVWWEVAWRNGQRIETAAATRMYVIGDSLSAANDADDAPDWPALLRNYYRVEVINLAQIGATVRTARAQAVQVAAGDSLVLIEIGGNDFLGDTTVSAFRDDLDTLLAELKQPGRQLVMLELPLPPLYNGYGQAQRELAARHDVVMIPRRHLAGVIFAHDATVDSLHLSATGQRLMAEMIWGQISGAFAQQGRQSLLLQESD